MADTGDGGDPTYAVARGLAAPRLTVPFAPGVPAPASAPPASGQRGGKAGGGKAAAAAPVASLPRADLLLLGGDLAYPNPSR